MNFDTSVNGIDQFEGQNFFALDKFHSDFFNTRLLVHKHVQISVDEWILEITHPHKQVTVFGIFVVIFCSEQIWKQNIL